MRDPATQRDDHYQPFTNFNSYRRQDTAPIALLLKSEIEKHLQLEEERYRLGARKLLPLCADCDGDFTQVQIPPRLQFLTDTHFEQIDYAD